VAVPVAFDAAWVTPKGLLPFSTGEPSKRITTLCLIAPPFDWAITWRYRRRNSNSASVQKEISFFSEQLGKKISGGYSIFGRMLTVTSSDGRQKSAPLGGVNTEMLARLILIELEAAKSE
jgi:hypothetical protein